MDKTEVTDLMSSSKSEAEWNANCNHVKAACGGYPDFWYSEIVQSGLMRRTAAKFGGTEEITISGIG